MGASGALVTVLWAGPARIVVPALRWLTNDERVYAFGRTVIGLRGCNGARHDRSPHYC